MQSSDDDGKGRVMKKAFGQIRSAHQWKMRVDVQLVVHASPRISYIRQLYLFSPLSKTSNQLAPSFVSFSFSLRLHILALQCCIVLYCLSRIKVYRLYIVRRFGKLSRQALRMENYMAERIKESRYRLIIQNNRTIIIL